MKTLKSQMFIVSGILLCVLITLVGIVINSAFEEKRLAKEYGIKNKIARHLNAAAGWQAIERGLGATILGSAKGDSSLLFPKFLEMGKKETPKSYIPKSLSKNGQPEPRKTIRVLRKNSNNGAKNMKPSNSLANKSSVATFPKMNGSTLPWLTLIMN